MAGRTPGRYSIDAQTACCGPPVASGPRDPKGRKSSALFDAPFCWFWTVRSGGGPNGPARRPGGSKNRKSTAHSSSGAPPGARGRRFLAESCYSLLAYSNSPPAGSATSPDELQSAAWGGGELRGSKSRKSSTPNSPQFSAPCPPHCGSAYAPPHSRRPLGFHLDFAHRKTSEIPLYAGGRRLFDGVDFFARRSDSSIFGYRRNS